MSYDVDDEAETRRVDGDAARSVKRIVEALGADDLLEDRNMKHFARVDYAGHECPVVGDYPLLKRIGKGGMGDVFTSVHPRLGNEVAVKVLRSDVSARNPSLRDRFVQEAQLAARLSQSTPHLVQVSDVGIDQRTGDRKSVV